MDLLLYRPGHLSTVDTEKVTTLNAFFALVFPDKVSQASMISKSAQRGKQLLAAGEAWVWDYF